MDYKQVITFWKEFNIPEVLPREVNLDVDKGFITTITGPRRAGKTFICFQMINKLLKENILKDNILYLNFDPIPF